jgi:hypothetical protein
MPGMDHILSKGFLATGGSVAYTFGQVVQQINAATGPLSVINQAQCQICPAQSPVGHSILGVCQENLDAVKTATGKAIIGIALQGNVKVVWDGVGTAAVDNAVVVPSTTVAGAVAFHTQTTTFANIPVVGIPLTLPAATGDVFDIQLTPGDRV